MSKVITDPQELYRFLSTPGIQVANLMFANETAWASWQFIAKQRVPSVKDTDEVIGPYVTAGARIHLYRCLDRLQQTALYCDTDTRVHTAQRRTHSG